MEQLFTLVSALRYAREHIVETVLCLLALYLATRVIVSYFNTWRKLPPGPWGFPIIGYLPFLGSEPHKTLAELKKKYGNIFGIRIGTKYCVVVNEYNLVKESFSHPASFNRPENLFGKMLKLGFGVASGQDWNEQRRFVLFIMRNLGLGKGPWENLAKEAANHFMEILRQYKGKPVAITKRLQETLASSIVSLLYGKKLQPDSDKQKIERFAEFSHFGLKHYGPSTPSTLIPGFHRLCEILNIGEYRKSANSAKNFLNMTKKEIDNHWTNEDYQNFEDYTNMYKSKLVEMKENKGKHFFNAENMVGHANSLFLGSSDTTTSSLKTLFRLMAKHPDVQKKIQEELDDYIGREGSISYDDRYNIPYTIAALFEAQRFISTVPLGNVRLLSENMEIGGYELPKGTWLISNIYALHNDQDYWKNPNTYNPERFLTEDKKQVIKNPKSFAPFSIGKRNCPGETVAWVMIINVFTKVMQNFTIHLAPGDEASLETEGGVVSHLKPQSLCFVERP